MAKSVRAAKWIQDNTPDTYKSYQFKSRDAAWGFMRACGADRLGCGFPKEDNTCEVNLTTFPKVQEYDRLAAMFA